MRAELDGFLTALSPYFSTPIARALVTSALRRAKLDPATLDVAAVPQAVLALERALPIYLADATRRVECVGRLRQLTANSSGMVADSAASTVVRVRTAEDVVNACDAGRDLARRVGFANVDQTKVATTISELARNIVLYALHGEVRISSIDGPRRGVEVTAIDEGPGIADVALVMSGAYRSRTGMGMGLKGAKRLMDSLEVTSDVGVGTTVVARKFVP